MPAVTKEFLLTYRTKNGAWTKKQLSALGIAWPPRRGWINRIVGKIITIKEAQTFMDDSGIAQEPPFFREAEVAQ